MPALFRAGYPHTEALRRVKATYAGFHGYVTTWMAEHRHLHEYLANRFGYRYFIEGFTLPPIPSGTHGQLDPLESAIAVLPVHITITLFMMSKELFHGRYDKLADVETE